MSDLTHFDDDGRARMVDISAKDDTPRRALARGRVVMSAKAFNIAKTGGGPKGDICAVAQLAGVMGAKRTSDLIPLCHPLPISGLKVVVEADEALSAFVVTAEVKTNGKTGVEMEALSAVTTACLTVYDMAKALDKSMVIEDVVLVEKTGGKSGDYQRKD